MSSAYKQAMLQAFCVPVAQIEDADASSHRLKHARTHQREPVEGWAMWTSGITDIVESCASADALERLRSGNGRCSRRSVASSPTSMRKLAQPSPSEP